VTKIQTIKSYFFIVFAQNTTVFSPNASKTCLRLNLAQLILIDKNRPKIIQKYSRKIILRLLL
jgi:hypothetical protein